MPATEIIQEHITFNSGDRRVEGALAYQALSDPAWACLLAGPHPMLGGEMGNNVLKSLNEHAVSAGAVVLSFNYAGIGASEGGPADWAEAISTFWRQASIPQETEWRDDAAAALCELTRATAGLPCAAIGYSFGCWAVTQAVSIRPVGALVLVSPNPVRHDFASLGEIAAPILVLYGDHEIDCSTSQMEQWCSRLREPKRIRRIEGAEHFFRRREDEVSQIILEFLTHEFPPDSRVAQHGN